GCCGSLPHRWSLAPGHEHSADRGRTTHLTHQDYVRTGHRGPAAPAGRPRPGSGERLPGGPPGLDPARLARREGRDPNSHRKGKVLSLDSLGMSEEEREAIKNLLNNKEGIVLVT